MPPCRVEAPDIQAAYAARAHDDRGLAVVAIYLGESAETVRDATSRLGLTYVHIADPATRLASAYRVWGSPPMCSLTGRGWSAAWSSGCWAPRKSPAGSPSSRPAEPGIRPSRGAAGIERQPSDRANRQVRAAFGDRPTTYWPCWRVSNASIPDCPSTTVRSGALSRNPVSPAAKTAFTNSVERPGAPVGTTALGVAQVGCRRQA
ncbi:MAG: TlpA family protein disulfide reductase [Actinomycetales bacterium]|nr:TlpA family protein disulfide reductase [Candidatus Phosphoribacter baldrii]